MNKAHLKMIFHIKKQHIKSFRSFFIILLHISRGAERAPYGAPLGSYYIAIVMNKSGYAYLIETKEGAIAASKRAS